MKILKTISLLLLSFTMLNSQAQSTIPQDYSKGTVLLANGTSLSGYIKDNMSKDAAVIFINNADNKKTEYDGDLKSVV